MKRMVMFLFVMAAATAAPSRAQPPTASPAAPSSSPAQPAPEETYTYRPAGRRDPFLNLRIVEVQSAPRRRGTGLAALTTDEVSVRGVVKSAGVLLAMVKGPDTRTFVVHAGDALADGTITAITADGLVIAQTVADPLSAVKQREVRKSLRMVDDTKE